MYKKWILLLAAWLSLPAGAQQLPVQDTFSEEESRAVAAILAKQNATQPPAQTTVPEPPQVTPIPPANTPAAEQPPAPDQEAGEDPAAKNLTVAFIDIDEAFNAHPRTIAVKEQIRLKILAKEEEVQNAKQLIEDLTQENEQLAAELRSLKPFYERIVVEPTPLLPKLSEPADTLLLSNLLNRLTFSRAQVLSASPLDTLARLESIKSQLAANKKTMAERSFFIDNYKYATREEILTLEKKEVTEILQDIYTEIKSFARKRNIGAIVRKDEVLYGASPVNVTRDFITRLKKSKKYRKRGA